MLLEVRANLRSRGPFPIQVRRIAIAAVSTLLTALGKAN